MNKRDFGSRLRAARRGQGISQEKLGVLLGLSHAAISRWEANESRPAFENLEALYEHLDVSIDGLMFGEVLPNRVQEPPAGYLDESMARSADELQLLKRYRSSSEERKKAILELLR